MVTLSRRTAEPKGSVSHTMWRCGASVEESSRHGCGVGRWGSPWNPTGGCADDGELSGERPRRKGVGSSDTERTTAVGTSGLGALKADSENNVNSLRTD